MSYRLIVTRPDGSQFQSSTEPLPDGEAVGMSALRTLAGQGVPFGCDGLTFGREVRDAVLGVAVTHPTGYAFRAEEF